MQTQSSDENSVCLSVRQTHDLWQNERKLCPHSYTTWKSKTIYLVLWQEKWLVGATASTWNFGSNWPRWSEIADFQSIFACCASAVTSTKKCQLLIGIINRKSTTRFTISLRWSSYVALKPTKGAHKRKTAVFRVKSHFAWRKSATKFLCVKTVIDKIVRHLLTYYPCTNDWWGRPLRPEIWTISCDNSEMVRDSMSVIII